MKVLTYRIKLMEPTLVTQLGGDPNSDTAFDYLPGSVLRGAIIGKYMRANNLAAAQLDAAGSNVRRLFFDGTTHYLNGYPVEKNRRALPTPLSWQSKKGEEDDIFDFAVRPRDHEDRQWKGIKKPFCLTSDDGARLVQPDRNIAVHTARTRRFGRAMPLEKIDTSKGDTQGSVYRYDALASGQTFEAVILCENSHATTLQDLLGSEVTLGGSRTGGYGRAKLTLENINEQSADKWREIPAHVGFRADVDGKLIVTLLSDALLRDGSGQFVVDADEVTKALTKQLKVSLNPYKSSENQSGNWAFLRGEVIGGFNRKWGLPLPQALAIKMGSVFVYHKPDGGDDGKLLELERTGIGERRVEGFGRIAVNWHSEETWTVDSSKSKHPANPVKMDVSTDSGRLAQQMVYRMLRRRLDELLVKKASDLGQNIRKPKNSQISRLRNIAQNALQQEPAEGRNRLNKYFKSLEDRKSTRDQFTRDRLGNESLLAWLKGRVADEQNIWNEIQFEPSQKPRIGDNVSADLTPLMAYEYNLRLIDAVLARAVKQRRGEGAAS